MISLKLAVLCMTIVLINGQSGFHRSPSRCANEDCDFTLYWNNRGDQTVFTFTARTFLDDFVWAGFALSDDQRMGHDDVIICSVEGSSAKVEHFYNTGMFTPALLDNSNPTVGLSDMHTKTTNGEITCTLTRQNSKSDTANYFDLSKKYYLLFAYGKMNGGQMQYHRMRTSSADKYFV